MANIMVIGGSYLQYDFINTAVKGGHNVNFVDKNPYCFSNCISKAKFHNFDFSDVKKLVNVCVEEKIESVISPANEIGNKIAARICSLLALPYNSEEVVQSTTDKALLKKKLSSSDISFPNFLIFEEGSMENLNNFQLPLIIKPSNSSGSRGVSSVYSKKEVLPAVNSAKKYIGDSGKILIEEMINGKQFSIETITSNSEHFIVGITEEIISGPPYFIERCHFMGSEIHEMYYKKFSKFCKTLLDKLGIKVGPCHIEVILQKEEIYLIEIGSRSGGWRDLLIKYAGAGNYNDLILKSYLGKEITDEDLKKPNYNSMIGILMYPKDLDKYVLAKKNGILQDEYFYGKGPSVFPENLIDAFGYFYVQNKGSLSKYKLN